MMDLSRMKVTNPLTLCLTTPIAGSDRCKLYRGWGKFANWYKFQPLDAIMKYYGVKIALYFAWLGFFTKMLIIPALAGLVVFAYGVSRSVIKSPSE